MSYIEKLKDPRWQRRRLEIMSRAGFACESCEATARTLNVHHKLYRKGADPWEYADDELECLCESCHQAEHQLRLRLSEALARFSSFSLDQVVGYAEALAMLEEPWRTIDPFSYEHAEGIGQALGLSADQVIALAERFGAVNPRNLPVGCRYRLEGAA